MSDISNIPVPIIDPTPELPKRRYRPKHDWIVLHKRAVEQKSKGGILLPHGAITGTDKVKPDENEHGAFEWVVVECGPGRMTDAGVMLPMVCKPGDVVDFVGKALPKSLDGREIFYVVRNDTITGVVELVDQPGASN